ncbi:MAG: transaldolase family protein [Patescibacteria group bacterium]
MKLFVDTARLPDIEAALKRGFVRGVTTNPSLLAKEPKGNFNAHVGKILDLINKYQPSAHLSVEVFSKDPQEILKQARNFKETFKHPQLSIKIPVGWDELEVIRELSQNGFSVNCTCNMSVSQALMAAAAGASYVSLFWGRIGDGGMHPNWTEAKSALIKKGAMKEGDFDPPHVVRTVRSMLDDSYPDAQIIVGSIRHGTDVIEAGMAGAHIVTVPPKFFPNMISHFKTDEVVGQFLKDFEKWLE